MWFIYFPVREIYSLMEFKQFRRLCLFFFNFLKEVEFVFSSFFSNSC